MKCILYLLACYLCGLVAAAQPTKYTNKKNLIFLVSDGTGATSFSFARTTKQTQDYSDTTDYFKNATYYDVLSIDDYVIGNMRTRSSSNLVTDSAAAATSFFCGIKTYNGAMSVDDDGTPHGTLFEAAKLADYKTGIVSTTFVQDATIGAPASHALSRKYYDLIASQMLGMDHPMGPVLDVILGSGKAYMYNKNVTAYGVKGARADDRDIISEAIHDGWQYVGNVTSFEELDEGKNVSLPLLGLFGAKNFPYEIDRNPKEYPSLKQMAITALNSLTEATKDSEQGFLLLIESARTDHAAHGNDAATHYHELAAHDEVWSAVVDYASQLDDETLVVSTSDHECGGLTLAKQLAGEKQAVYDWYPEFLLKANNSGEYCGNLYSKYNGTDNSTYIKTLLTDYMGVAATNITDDDIQKVLKAPSVAVALGQVASDKAHVGWSTTGHSGADVPIYAYANNRNAYEEAVANIGANVENIELADFFAYYLDVDLSKATEKVADIKVKP
ncbi:uncharacterized protein KQ657_003559 [Scheffersomyces spartinae]|uniref:Alkaline phosphatase n=1 Tax=Scheffersomyces spartinae TaxID=45513 RepID=A0A9P8AFW3_9ASCO|nr:uncharacterized protein KQ657_003559 [Scheffersomyces spartinae]KAG7191318.1 hypothetical protein KQ657_003559 [Scheffersomyces spartinae]